MQKVLLPIAETKKLALAKITRDLFIFLFLCYCVGGFQ